jgi:hypothetical protein
MIGHKNIITFKIGFSVFPENAKHTEEGKDDPRQHK